MSTQSETPLLCPTFSSYTRDGSVETATRVSNDYKSSIGEDENDDLFEFESGSPAVRKSAVYPVFNREALHNDIDKKIEKLDDSVLVVPLKTLFLEEERENRISTSSSDESDDEAAEPSCMWRRKGVGSSPSPSDCKKSRSTGSVLFKRFKICDLLRSSSDGKESYLFSAKIDKSSNKIDYRKSPGRVTGKVKAAPASSAHELFYVQNRSIKEGDKRKSFLPYRKDLVGFFSVLGRASRT
ncbi:hypothetical protein DCAR_0415770 [Daucus carota subsp. sativus]|uniref:Uncharacterized protein n=1 Tax=Daucus carota subsp. sativus TaxID=79200 RepID=A0A162A9R6_DAUCS|nr:PREDICTED: uncharacterized protein LOC108217714 [Daucus carota subsp. sativus]WOG96435.1 hypothetical protein DCAR_0415770 [Daucus carota subsp. sativus]